MARVRVTQELNAGVARAQIGARGGNLERNLELRGVAVRSAAQKRLRSDPRRIDTGNLINSIQLQTIFRNRLPVIVIGTNVEYSIYVHEGTSRMRPNPFLRDGLAEGMRQFN